MSGRFWLILLLTIVATALVGWKLVGRLQPEDPTTISQVCIRRGCVSVELAVTSEAQQRGLSGRAVLPPTQGMLFIFAAPGVPSFWMKDMQFPIDIIWINNQTVVDVSENVPVPKNFWELPTYSPSSPVTHVLEVNAGWASANGVQIGDQLLFR